MAQSVHPLTILPDLSFALAVTPTDWVLSKALVADTAEAFAVPTGAKYVIFGADCSFAVRYNAATSGTAAAFGDNTTGDACEINPTIRFLVGGSAAATGIAEISVITHATTGNVSAAFYSA